MRDGRAPAASRRVYRGQAALREQRARDARGGSRGVLPGKLGDDTRGSRADLRNGLLGGRAGAVRADWMLAGNSLQLQGDGDEVDLGPKVPQLHGCSQLSNPPRLGPALLAPMTRGETASLGELRRFGELIYGERFQQSGEAPIGHSR